MLHHCILNCQSHYRRWLYKRGRWLYERGRIQAVTFDYSSHVQKWKGPLTCGAPCIAMLDRTLQLTDARTLQLAITMTDFLSALVMTNFCLKYLQALTSNLQAEKEYIVVAVKEHPPPAPSPWQGPPPLTEILDTPLGRIYSSLDARTAPRMRVPVRTLYANRHPVVRAFNSPTINLHRRNSPVWFCTT